MKLTIKEKQTIPLAIEETAHCKRQEELGATSDIGLLLFRLVAGGLLAGHGAQKLFDWFGGPGFKGTAGFLESLGLEPGTFWASGASAGEFGGGMCHALGFLHPLGPLGILGAMTMALAKAHWGKPIWANQGGAELPVLYMASALGLIFTGPGRYSLDSLFGIRLPRALVITAALIEAALVRIGIKSRPAPLAKQQATAPIEAGMR